MSIRRAYGLADAASGHPLSLPFLVVTAGAVAVSCWQRSVAVAAISAVVGWLLTRRFEAASGRAFVVVVLVVAVAVWRADAAHEALSPDELGPFVGWVRLVDDPQPRRGATRVIVEVEGERFEAWVRGRARQQRAGRWRGGEHVLVSGDRTELDPERAVRVRWQHVVGELELAWASDVRPGSAVDRASNRVRSAIERGAAVLPGDDGSLFRGLVVGDDREQPIEMIERFRASGLSHLTAVSGQNVPKERENGRHPPNAVASHGLCGS